MTFKENKKDCMAIISSILSVFLFTSNRLVTDFFKDCFVKE